MSTIDATLAALAEFGAELVRIDRQHKHPRVYFRHHGRDRFYVCSGSTGDRRAHENARSDIRHLLGMVNGTKRIGKRQRRKWHAPAAPAKAPATLTVGRDCLASLRAHPLAAQAAWSSFWRDCMESVGADLVWPWNGERVCQ